MTTDRALIFSSPIGLLILCLGISAIYVNSVVWPDHFQQDLAN